MLWDTILCVWQGRSSTAKPRFEFSPTPTPSSISSQPLSQLLHDFDAETSPVVLSQAALLLSFWLPPEGPKGRKSNTFWLTRAVQHAKDAGAHLYAHHVQSQPASLATPDSSGNLLKRLWWSCIIRDRLIALALRKGTVIKSNSFDPTLGASLDAFDLEDEIHRSRVYDSNEKKVLLQLVVRLSRFCVVLTDLLNLTPYPEDGDVWRKDRHIREDFETFLRVETELGVWYQTTSNALPVDQRQGFVPEDRSADQTPVTLHINMVYLYY